MATTDHRRWAASASTARCRRQAGLLRENVFPEAGRRALDDPVRPKLATALPIQAHTHPHPVSTPAGTYPRGRCWAAGSRAKRQTVCRLDLTKVIRRPRGPEVPKRPATPPSPRTPRRSWSFPLFLRNRHPHPICPHRPRVERSGDLLKEARRCPTTRPTSLLTLTIRCA